MKKRNLLKMILFIILAVFSLTACKKAVGTPEDNAVKEEAEEEEETAVYKFGFSGITMENPYYITLEAALREEIEKEGHTLLTQNPGMNVDTQIVQIEEMIEEGIDAIFLSPVDWQAITPALEALKEAEVKIINIDTQVKETDYVDAYIGSDNKHAGFICGEDLMERLPNGGKIVILEAPSMNSVNERITGFEESIANKGFEVVVRRDTMGDLSTSLAVMTEILKEHKDIDAVMCGNDPTALGALVAANSAGMKGILIYGVDGSPDLKKELQKQDTLIAGTGAQSPINMGKEAASVGIRMLSGEDYDTEILEETFLINKDNVELYGVDGWQ